MTKSTLDELFQKALVAAGGDASIARRAPSENEHKKTANIDPKSWAGGACLTLALALKRYVGRSAKLIDIVEPEPKSSFLLFPGRPHHVMVEWNKKLWDAEGPQDKEDVLRKWKDRLRVSNLIIEPHNAKRARDQNLKLRQDLMGRANYHASLIVSNH
jgi:hypothetical protein